MDLPQHHLPELRGRQDILFLFSLLSPDLRDRLLKVIKNNPALPEKNKLDTKFGVA